MNILIEAPDDIHVEQIAARPGRVKKGDLLFKLRSFAVETMQIKIELFKQHIEIMERPFKDGRIDREIEHLKKKAELQADTMQASQRALDRRNAAYFSLYLSDKYTAHNPPPLVDSARDLAFFPMKTRTIGNTGNPLNVDDPENPQKIIQVDSNSTTFSQGQNPDYKSDYALVVEHNKNVAEYLDAKSTAEQSELKKQDNLDKLALTKTKLTLYEQFLKEKIDSLSISAGADGTFSPHVFVASFVKKGHPLGELAP